MDSIISRASYLNGLIEGLGITNETKEGKAITELANVLKDMAIEVGDLQRAQEEIENFMDDMSDDLCDIENEVFGYEDDECECEEDCCDGHGENALT